MRILSSLLRGGAVSLAALLSVSTHAQNTEFTVTSPAPAAPTLLAQVARESVPAGVAQRSGGGSLPGGTNPAGGAPMVVPPQPAVPGGAGAAAAPSMPAAAPAPPAVPLPAPVPPPSVAPPAPPVPQAAASPPGGGGSAVVMVPAGARPIAPRAVLPKMRTPDRARQHAGKKRPASAGDGNSASEAGR